MTSPQNQIYLLPDLKWPASVTFRQNIYTIVNKLREESIIVDFSNVNKAYPNGIVPIISEINRYKQQGIKFIAIPPTDEKLQSVFLKMGWLHYIDTESYSLPSNYDSATSIPLQKFSSFEELNNIVNKTLNICLQQLSFSQGVFNGFEWVLNEILDNVITHSNSDCGWLQLVTYPDSHKLAWVICDSGIGIPNTIKKVRKFDKDKQAIEMAIIKGVTSRPGQNMGHGLAGAIDITRASIESSFAITSGEGRITLIKDNIQSEAHWPPLNGTCVEMQIDTSMSINFANTLLGDDPGAGGYIENRFEDDEGDVKFNLQDYASNFGNRFTGESIRRLVSNLLKQYPDKSIKIIMNNIRIISSSFADELFGKLAVELGRNKFIKIIKLEGANDICQAIINSSIEQRLEQTAQANSITKF
ncbi:hypothetical protein ANSO36C_65320 (plasmid) [Nostoc cf. commune SO-36]|uniref:DUF4325 domain-containing protein n=1 Tax=Nostoc cf. commune SO-36 TaxID=449208 RepID=A0ABN6QD19_NOSCO|nr:DUF4325 domain-containing protein [Nostoc commune]BDI20730.1 hypothetical protein ANSO36C_65320 [Nostoc cf. commune SO-36]